MGFLALHTFGLLMVVGVLLSGQRWKRARLFREKMVKQWKAALGIALIYLVAFLLGRGFTPVMFLMGVIGMVGMYCLSLIGLTLTRSIGSFEPLPVTHSLKERQRLRSRLVWLLGVALLSVPVSIVLGSIGTGVGHVVFHESIPANSGSSLFPLSKWRVFFQFLNGAGMIEETLFRLVILTLGWWVTGKKWLAILLSAVAFGAYHLSPLDSFYLTFWHYPLSQFLSSTLIGLLWGWIYTWRGYETAVLSHTLSDWLPFALFT